MAAPRKSREAAVAELHGRDEAVAKLHAAALDELSITRTRVENAYEDRDAAVRRAYADGVPATAIAEAVGLTRSRVYQIANAPS